MHLISGNVADLIRPLCEDPRGGSAAVRRHDLPGRSADSHAAHPHAAHLHVVSNRLPITWDDRAGWRQAPGGLVTALGSVVRPCDVSWIGSAATLGRTAPALPSTGTSTSTSTAGISTATAGRVLPVAVDAETVRHAVNGMSNSVLWPALHGMDHHVRQRAGFWDGYVAYNQRFADEVVRSSAPGDAVWLHDYHLLLAPAMIKSARPDLSVGLSIHTPFDAAAMSELVDRRELAAALSANDLIGVQTLLDADQLGGFLAGLTGSEPHIIVSPVSIDPDGVIELAACGRSTGGIGAGVDAGVGAGDDGPTRRLIVGVDRLDYTKALVERLRGYDIAFRNGTVRPDDVHIVQIAQPSRTDIDDYRRLHVEFERLVHELSTRWRRTDGTAAIEVRLGTVDRPDVLALLGRADVAMVTPARDGMNLVAKEFSVLTEDTGGVLVLSSRAGAAAELGMHSVLVDGADASSVARGLAAALDLGADRRLEMSRARARTVRAWTARDWSTRFVATLMRTDVDVVVQSTLSRRSRTNNTPGRRRRPAIDRRRRG